MTIQEAARTAIDVQDACNASGVIFSLAQATRAVCDEAARKGQGTDWRNRHPIIYLFVNKLADLTGQNSLDTNAYGECYSLCERIAAGNSDAD